MEAVHGYTVPVNKLLALGECRSGDWIDYSKLGLRREDVPELIRMATDASLHEARSEGPEVWAPIHAWRALGQLRAEEAIEPLTKLFHEQEEDDWVREELPVVYGLIGEQAIPTLRVYLYDPTHGAYPRVAAAHSLKEIGTIHPDARQESVSALIGQLKHHDQSDPTLNGFLLAYLCDLKAREAAEAIREAFAKGTGWTLPLPAIGKMFKSHWGSKNIERPLDPTIFCSPCSRSSQGRRRNRK